MMSYENIANYPGFAAWGWPYFLDQSVGVEIRPHRPSRDLQRENSRWAQSQNQFPAACAAGKGGGILWRKQSGLPQVGHRTARGTADVSMPRSAYVRHKA